MVLIAILFVSLNGLALQLTDSIDPVYQAIFWIGLAVWAGLYSTGEYWLQQKKPGQDRFIYPLVGLLLGWGILLVARLAPNFLMRHLLWVGLGLGTMLLVAQLPRDLRYLRLYPYTIMLFGILLLLSTLIFGVSPTGFGPRMWLKFPLLPVYFQPSELLKLLFVVFLAGYFSQREQFRLFAGDDGPRRLLGIDLAYFGPLLIVWGFCMVLLVWQQDLGAATLFFFSFVALLYLATGERIYLIGGGVLIFLGSLVAYFLFDRVNLRVNAWINPWPEATDRAFQIVQSLYAIAAGRIFGSGIGQGYPFYIPVVHSDFALAAIAEEWGLIGSLSIIAIFMIIVWRGFHIAIGSKLPFYRYLAAGISVFTGLQSLMIMGGVAKLLPLTGVTLPMVSYGGSSMLISSIMFGLLIWLSHAGTE